jgi:methionine-rich copper-binding protein CopC
MNAFVKSGLTLALTLCAFGTAYAHAHLLESAPAADAVVMAAPGFASPHAAEAELGIP